MTPTTNHPDAATLAAYLDRRLPEAERLQVVEHLAACPDCWERASDAADVLEDLEGFEDDEVPRSADTTTGADPAGDRVLPFPGSLAPARPTTVAMPRPWTPWALAATLLVAAVGAALWLSPLSLLPGGPSLGAHQLAAHLPEADGWRGHLEDQPWGTVRGDDDASVTDTAILDPDLAALEDQQAALELGARTVRLHAALAADDRTAARRQLRAMAHLADQLSSISLLPQEYRALASRLQEERDPAPESHIADAVWLDERAGDNLQARPETRTYALGKWAEAGRLVALSGDPDALDDPTFRGLPKALQRIDWPQRLAEPLATLEDLLARDDAAPTDVAEAFAAVLAAG